MNYYYSINAYVYNRSITSLKEFSKAAQSEMSTERGSVADGLPEDNSSSNSFLLPMIAILQPFAA